VLFEPCVRRHDIRRELVGHRRDDVLGQLGHESVGEDGPAEPQSCSIAGDADVEAGLERRGLAERDLHGRPCGEQAREASGGV